MKLAYFGYDGSALRSLNFFSQSFKSVDFYLAQDTMPQILSIEQVPILTRNFFIDVDERQRTSEQKKIHQRLSENISRFTQLYSNEAVLLDEPAPLANAGRPADSSLILLAEVLSVHQADGGLIEVRRLKENKLYDFVAVEPSVFMKIFFSKLNNTAPDIQKLLNSQSDQQLIFLNFKYPKKNRYTAEFSEKKIIVVENIDLDSIVDNFYLCQLEEQEISIDFLISASKHQDAEYINFLAQRARRTIADRFLSLELGEVAHYSLYPSQSHFTAKKNRNSFSLPYARGLTENQLNYYLSKRFDSKFFTARSSEPKELR